MNNKSLAGLIIITSLVIWGLVVWGKSPAPGAGSSQSNGQVASSQIEKITDPDELVLGSIDAPIQIIEYADVQCPACAYFDTVLNQVLEQRADKIQYVFRHFPLSYHSFAKEGALALQASHRQGKFKEMKDQLYLRQQELGSDMIARTAQAIGLNMDKYNQDIKDPKLIQKIEKELQDSLSRGFSGTPTIFLNGEELKNFSSADELIRQIDKIIQSS